MSEVTEEKKLTGIAAYHAKKREAKEQEKQEQELNGQVDAGIKEQKAILKAEKAENYKGKDEMDFGIRKDKTYVFQLINGSGQPRHVMLGSKCKIFDGERIRNISYIPVSDTIFDDEMEGRFDGYPEPTLSFHKDFLTAEGTDTRLVEYLLSHELYDGNTTRLNPRKDAMFTLVNKEDLEKRKEAQHARELKAMNIINDSDIRELLPISRIIFNSMETDPTTVRNLLRDRAKKNPQDILDNMESPRVGRRYMIQLALDQGVVEINVRNSSLIWADTQTFIKEMKATTDTDAAVKEIADFTFTEKGTKVYDILKQKIA